MSEATGGYTSEMRFGVVMYGGVSLALYINGVANELFEACCATPKEGAAVGEGSRTVYRKLSWLLANPGLRALARGHAKGEVDTDPFDASGTPRDPAFASERQRFVVDVIAGTSAGGINGVFLAKALATGQPFAPLQKLWVDEGDIALLLNDERSACKPLQASKQPASLLNSDRMYLKLLEAMETMQRSAKVLPLLPEGRSPLADEIDLFVTTTDIEGAVVPLRLFDKVVHERRHRQVFKFRYAEPDSGQPKSDFADADSPFLAFAARCTSSFPFAFEPMTLADAQRICTLRRQNVDFTDRKRFFKGLGQAELAGDAWMQRPFGDGGYLDNKPFSHAVEALSHRQAVLPVERKLLYIEPAPAHPEQEAMATGKPNALQNAVAALTSIPQYETIREDLQAVLKRNRRIERVERMVRLVESDVESHREDPFAKLLLQEGQVPDWAALDLGAMLDYYGSAFLPYRRLRLNTVSDELAQRLGARWGVDAASDLQYALRALVRAWREERYYDHEAARTPTQTASVNAFLSQFDLSYRRRRAAFLMRKTQQLLRMLPRLPGLIDGTVSPAEGEEALLTRLRRHAGDGVALDAAKLQPALLVLRQGMAQTLRSLRDTVAPEPAPDDQRRQLDALLRLLMGETSAEPLRELPGVDGQPVRVAAGQLPLPSPLQTLQQNVFDRARRLFGLARVSQPTQLQAALEKDLDAMRLEAGESSAAKGLAQLRELLGKPQLAPEIRHVPGPDGQPQALPPRVVVQVDAVDAKLPGAAALNTLEGEVLRKLLAEYRSRFDEFDQVAFPLYYDTGTGEPSTVEVVRISPEDAPSLVERRSAAEQRKLAGTALFNFGGFLDANWRRNDILWGRLDGAERLLAALLPAAEDEGLRAQLLAEAQRAILRDGLAPGAYEELVQRFAAALRESGQPSLQAAFGSLWQGLGHDDEARHSRLAQALRAVLGDQGLHQWMSDHYKVQRELPAGPMLETAARAVTITGRMLQGIEQSQRIKAERAIWLTRAGLAAQALLSLSVPGSIAANVVRHWVHRIYLFAGFLFLGGLLLAAPAVRNFGLGLFVLVAVLDLLLRIAGDARHKQWGWLKFGVGLVVGGVLLLAGLGLWGGLRLGWRTLLGF